MSVPLGTKRVCLPDYVKIRQVHPSDIYSFRGYAELKTKVPDVDHLPNTRLYVCSIWGPARDTEEFENALQSNVYQNGFSLQELTSQLKDLIGLPVLLNHPIGKHPVLGIPHAVLGAIVGVFQEEDTGRTMGLVRFFDDIQSQQVCTLIETGACRGMSITFSWWIYNDYDAYGHITRVHRKFQFLEFSVCMLGKQRESGIYQIWEVDPMPPWVDPLKTDGSLMKCRPFQQVISEKAFPTHSQIYQLGLDAESLSPSLDCSTWIDTTQTFRTYRTAQFFTPFWFPMASSSKKERMENSTFLSPSSSIPFSLLSPSPTLDLFFLSSSSSLSSPTEIHFSTVSPLDDLTMSTTAAPDATPTTTAPPTVHVDQNQATEKLVVPDTKKEEQVAPAVPAALTQAVPATIEPQVTQLNTTANAAAVPVPEVATKEPVKEPVKETPVMMTDVNAANATLALSSSDVTARLTYEMLNDPNVFNQIANDPQKMSLIISSHSTLESLQLAKQEADKMRRENEALRQELAERERLQGETGAVMLHMMTDMLRLNNLQTSNLESGTLLMQENSATAAAAPVDVTMKKIESEIEQNRDKIVKAFGDIQRYNPTLYTAFNNTADMMKRFPHIYHQSFNQAPAKSAPQVKKDVIAPTVETSATVTATSVRPAVTNPEATIQMNTAVPIVEDKKPVSTPVVESSGTSTASGISQNEAAVKVLFNTDISSHLKQYQERANNNRGGARLSTQMAEQTPTMSTNAAVRPAAAPIVTKQSSHLTDYINASKQKLQGLKSSLGQKLGSQQLSSQTAQYRDMTTAV